MTTFPEFASPACLVTLGMAAVVSPSSASSSSSTPSRELPWYPNYMLSSNLSTPRLNSTVMQGTTVLFVDIPSPCGEVSVFRRLDTDYVNATHMFRAAYPTAGSALEQREITWLLTQSESNTLTGARFGNMAGTWVPLSFAKILAKDYGLEKHVSLLFAFNNPVERHRKAQKVTFLDINDVDLHGQQDDLDSSDFSKQEDVDNEAPTKKRIPDAPATASRADLLDLLSADLKVLHVKRDAVQPDRLNAEHLVADLADTAASLSVDDDLISVMSVDEPLEEGGNEERQMIDPVRQICAEAKALQEKAARSSSVTKDDEAAVGVSVSEGSKETRASQRQERPPAQVSKTGGDAKRSVESKPESEMVGENRRLKRRCDELEQEIQTQRKRVRYLALAAATLATTTAVPFLLG